jgi:Holliday junction resolvasome RuvABC ATP-dependent DNA helicase subunit
LNSLRVTGDDVVFIQMIHRIQRKELCVLELTKGTDVVFIQMFQRIQRKKGSSVVHELELFSLYSMLNKGSLLRLYGHELVQNDGN